MPDKTEFLIRPIQKKDNDSVHDVIHQVMPEFNCTGPGFALSDSEVDHMYESYQSPGFAYFVLEHDGKVVGGGGVAPLEGGSKDICELRKMYFLSVARGTGMGRKLLERCLSEAKKLNYKKCYLETTDQMVQAQRLYLRTGFEPLQKPMGNTGHNGCDRWYLKEL